MNNLVNTIPLPYIMLVLEIHVLTYPCNTRWYVRWLSIVGTYTSQTFSDCHLGFRIEVRTTKGGGYCERRHHVMTHLNRSLHNGFLNGEKYRLLDSLVVECWLQVREVPVSIPSQGPRHTKDVIKMVPENNVMDKIWYKKSFKVGGHWPLWRG